MPRKLERKQDSPTAQCTSFADQLELPASSCLGLPIDVQMTIMLSALRYVQRVVVVASAGAAAPWP